MTKKGWLIFIGLTVAMLAGLIFFGNNGADEIKIDETKINSIQKPSKDNGQIGDHIYGWSDSPVILIEYADYQCPGCSQVTNLILNPIKELYKDKIAFVFRNFPLTSKHPNAIAAASAAEAAGLQNKYWEANQKLYEEQDSWSNLTGENRNNYFFSMAKEFGLDQEKFKEDMASLAVKSKIAYDTAISSKLKLSATPSIFINGKFFNSSNMTLQAMLESIREQLDSSLKENGIEAPAKQAD